MLAAASGRLPRPIITAHGCEYELLYAEDAGTAAELHALLWRSQDAAAAAAAAAAGGTARGATTTGEQ